MKASNYRFAFIYKFNIFVSWKQQANTSLSRVSIKDATFFIYKAFFVGVQIVMGPAQRFYGGRWSIGAWIL